MRSQLRRFYLAVLMTGASLSAGADALSDGTKRILVVAGPSAHDPRVRAEDRLLQADPQGLAERDVQVVRVLAGVVDPAAGSVLDGTALLKAVGLRSTDFGLALIGKDGSVKLRQSSPITLTRLFAVIDAMPMRQREARQRSDGGQEN